MMHSQQIDEIMIEQRQRQLEHISPHTIAALDEMHRHEGVRRAVASALVRLGMTLDHDAGVREALAR
ncbi:MAG: hypothetical protein WEB52_15890 [Dehalococcoidia bacterium]